MKRFNEIASKITNQYVNTWVGEGKKVVGYTCSFLPPEVFHAAGILPYRLRGIETESIEIGDAYYGPYVCTFPKCLLQLAGQGKYHFLKGAVISTGCDAMRRLDECWRKAGEDHPGATPEFFHYFDVPHKTDLHALNWFEKEIRRIIEGIENHFKVKVEEAALKEAIDVYNHGRSLLWKLELLRGTTQAISGADAFAVSVASTVMPRIEFNKILEEALEEIGQQNRDASPGTKRVMIAGSIIDDSELVRLIESCQATVVADSLCFGVRGADDLVSTEGDPIKALAYRYLSDSVCPRMFGAYQQRFDFLKAKVERAHVDGIILQNIRFCDLHGSENGLFERDFEALGIPCLRLEREYGPLTETGRMKMRVDAFLESLKFKN